MVWFSSVGNNEHVAAAEHDSSIAAPVRRITGRRFMMVKRADDGGFSLEPVFPSACAGA